MKISQLDAAFGDPYKRTRNFNQIAEVDFLLQTLLIGEELTPKITNFPNI